MKLKCSINCLLICAAVGCSHVECNRAVSQDKLNQVNQAQLAIDQQIIKNYVVANNLGPTQEVNGITYILVQEGSGGTPCLENEVTFTYEGRFLTDGKVFDKNSSGLAARLTHFILGWQLSFPSFPKGTQATIFVPSGFAYGSAGRSPNIPPDAILIFDVHLTNIK